MGACATGAAPTNARTALSSAGSCARYATTAACLSASGTLLSFPTLFAIENPSVLAVAGAIASLRARRAIPGQLVFHRRRHAALKVDVIEGSRSRKGHRRWLISSWRRGGWWWVSLSSFSGFDVKILFSSPPLGNGEQRHDPSIGPRLPAMLGGRRGLQSPSRGQLSCLSRLNALCHHDTVYNGKLYCYRYRTYARHPRFVNRKIVEKCQ